MEINETMLIKCLIVLYKEHSINVLSFKNILERNKETKKNAKSY